MNLDQPLFDESIPFRKIAMSNEKYRFENGGDDSASGESEAYSQMVQEVERVTETLVQTQTWLKETDEENAILRGAVEELRREDETLRNEIQRLHQEILDRDEARTRPDLEQRLRKAVEFLKKDLEKLTEKYENAEEQIESHHKTIAELKVAKLAAEAVANERDSRVLSSVQELSSYKDRLNLATSGNAALLEEVASLREELAHTKKIAEQKDVLIRKEVETEVKEKIKFEVREAVTQQVTEKVSREVSAKVKAQRDTEIRALRDQLKKVIKENSDLQAKIEDAEQQASEAVSLRRDIEALTTELANYEIIVCDARRDYELHLTKLETDYRIQMQAIREEASKKKWAHASEIRKQIMVEREREAEKFAERIDSLSKETDRLLDQAEKEKEKYANSLKRRVQKDMEKEIQALTEKLESQSRETEQVHQAIEEEKARETTKYKSLVDSLTKENDCLRAKVLELEEEIEQAWQEGECLEKELKMAEEEKLTQKRKLHNLTTLNNRYKHDATESNKEMEKMKERVQEACAKEDQIQRHHARILSQAEGVSRETISTLEDTKKSLILRVKLYEKENSHLRTQNEALQNAFNGPAQKQKEKVISELKTQVDELLKVKMDYSNQFQALETKLDQLELDLSASRFEIKRCEAALRKTREEKQQILRQMDELKTKSSIDLRRSEGERSKLQSSLDDIKRSLRGLPSKDSSENDEHDFSVRSDVENRDAPQEHDSSGGQGEELRDQVIPYSRSALVGHKETNLSKYDTFVQRAEQLHETLCHRKSSVHPRGQKKDLSISKARNVTKRSSHENPPQTKVAFYPQQAEKLNGSLGKIKKYVRWDLPVGKIDVFGDDSGGPRDESRNPSTDHLNDEQVTTDVENREAVASARPDDESGKGAVATDEQWTSHSSEEDCSTSSMDSSSNDLKIDSSNTDKTLPRTTRMRRHLNTTATGTDQSSAQVNGDVDCDCADQGDGDTTSDNPNRQEHAEPLEEDKDDTMEAMSIQYTQVAPFSFLGRLRKSEYPRSFRKPTRARWARGASTDAQDTKSEGEVDDCTEGFHRELIQEGDKGIDDEGNSILPAGDKRSVLETMQTSE